MSVLWFIFGMDSLDDCRRTGGRTICPVSNREPRSFAAIGLESDTGGSFCGTSTSTSPSSSCRMTSICEEDAMCADDAVSISAASRTSVGSDGVEYVLVLVDI